MDKKNNYKYFSKIALGLLSWRKDTVVLRPLSSFCRLETSPNMNVSEIPRVLLAAPGRPRPPSAAPRHYEPPPAAPGRPRPPPGITIKISFPFFCTSHLRVRKWFHFFLPHEFSQLAPSVHDEMTPAAPSRPRPPPAALGYYKLPPIITSRHQIL